MQVPQAAAAAAARPGSKYCSGSHKSAIKNAYTHVPHTQTHAHTLAYAVGGKLVKPRETEPKAAFVLMPLF